MPEAKQLTGGPGAFTLTPRQLNRAFRVYFDYFAIHRTSDVKPAKARNTDQNRSILFACLLALVFSTGASWFFFSRWEETSDKYSALLAQQYGTSQQLLQIQDELNRIHPDLDVMRDTEYDVYTLEPVSGKSEDRCRIYWNPFTGEALLDPINLAEAEKGMAYRIEYCQGVEDFTLLLQPEGALNPDQLLPLGNIADVTGWRIRYGPADGPEDRSFVVVAATR